MNAPAASPARRRYRCLAGQISLACENESQWRSLAKCLGRPELAYPGSWETVTSSPPRGLLARVLEAIFLEDSAAVWQERLLSHGVPCSATDK
ncbi:MAG TPA: CoA transferase [Dehalococcoidia bacterium]|nr:CoA transferase [Dehalococcoidia bacterium]